MSTLSFHCNFVQCFSNFYLPISSIAVSKYTCNKLLSLQLKRLGQTKKFLSTKAEKSYYEVLELSPKATQAQIKESYYRLSLKYHPDQHQGNEMASENFRNITEAYEVLINLQKKKLYDRGLYQGKAGPVTSADGATLSRASLQPQKSSHRMSAFSVDQWHHDYQKNLVNAKFRQDARAEVHKAKQKITEVKKGSSVIIYVIFALILAYYEGKQYLSKKSVKVDSKDR